MELHGLLHGIDEVLLSPRVQRRDVVPGAVEVLHVFLDLRLVRLAAERHEGRAGFADFFHLG